MSELSAQSTENARNLEVVKRSDLRTAFNFGGVFDSIFPWAK